MSIAISPSRADRSQTNSSASLWNGLDELNSCDFELGDEILVKTQPETAFWSPEAKTLLETTNTSSSLGKRPRPQPPILPNKTARICETKPAPQPKPRSSPKPRINPEPATDDAAPVIIANNPKIKRIFDQRHISTGVRFELARLVSLGRLSYDDIANSNELDKLEGSNATAAAKAAQILLKGGKTDDKGIGDESESMSPWAELDAEEQILSENPLGGIGNNATHPSWYGGKVHFQGVIHLDDKSKIYSIRLSHAYMSTSCKFTRRFGSASFLRIKIPIDIFFDGKTEMKAFFLRPLVIWGEVYRALYAKDTTVFFWKTNEVYYNEAIRTSPTSLQLSLWAFIQWANPLNLGDQQKLCKWSARFHLGFSDSVPGPLFEPENIREIEDIVSAGGSDMTDGCGLGNLALVLLIRNMHSLPHVPTGVQFRLRGAKGMVSCKHASDGTDIDAKPIIWLRPSQIKIHFPKGVPLDPSHLTMDLLRVTDLSTPGRLSPELIINLAYNKVPVQAITELQHQSNEEAIQPLFEWEGHNALFKLWSTVEQSEGVLASRRARQSPDKSRFQGYGDQKDEEIDEEDALTTDFDAATTKRSVAWFPDPVSGCPSSLAETVMALLDAGFDPKEQSAFLLRHKLKEVTKSKIRQRCSKFNMKVLMSAIGFVIPDPVGVLGENQIQIRSSHDNLRSKEGFDVNVITGWVLITRNPCKCPTDTQRVFAVAPPELANLTNVIVCNVKDYRRLLDFLGGGDYDGDKATVIWDPRFTETFKNADEKHSNPPKGLDFKFIVDKTTVATTCPNLAGQTEEDRCRTLQSNALLGALRNPSIMGKYASFHTNAVYTLGYDHRETVELSYKFCKVLDAPKTGHTIRPDVWRTDQAKYNHPVGPAWRAKIKGKNPAKDTSNSGPLKRPPNLGRFVMDTLISNADREQTFWMKKIDDVYGAFKSSKGSDETLLAPWKEQRALIAQREELKQDLAIIEAHVERVLAEHGKSKQGDAFTEQKIQKRQDDLRMISRLFHSFPETSDMKCLSSACIREVRASYAYKLRPTTQFPFDVAFRDLCEIKARAGQSKTCQLSFYERFKMTKGRDW